MEGLKGILDSKKALLVTVVLACLLHLVNISVPTLAICLAMWFGAGRPADC